jgi:hypothetical protein
MIDILIRGLSKLVIRTVSDAVQENRSGSAEKRQRASSPSHPISAPLRYSSPPPQNTANLIPFLGAKFCGNCGSAFSEEDRFCGSCGDRRK